MLSTECMICICWDMHIIADETSIFTIYFGKVIFGKVNENVFEH